MKAVTIGCGDYLELANYSASQFSRFSGLPTVVITDRELVKSFSDYKKVKFDLFSYVDDDDIIYFDADLTLVKEFDFGDLFTSSKTFYACRDLSNTAIIQRESSIINADKNTYINSGFMKMNRIHHSGVMELAYEHSQRIRSEFSDQTFINKALIDLGTPIQFVPVTFNYINFNLKASRVMYPFGIHLNINKHYTVNKDRLPAAVASLQELVIDTDFKYRFDLLPIYAGMYEYDRVGLSKRIIEFRQDGTIGYNSKNMEVFWHPVEHIKTGATSIIIDNYTDTTCVLHRSYAFNDVVFKGHWLKFEKSETAIKKIS